MIDVAAGGSYARLLAMGAPSELPELIGGKYRLLYRLGEGAMGTVYVAEHALTGEHLAIKLMSTQARTGDVIERFKREARASARIRSENVVRVIDADVDVEMGRTPYLVMDLLEGADLEQVAGDVPQPAPTVVLWLRQVARALDKAHALGIVHRDLKPENVFLTRRESGEPLVKILDFGIAKVLEEPIGTTQSGQILGTPLYMSPEQARGDAKVLGSAADRYALGLMAYRLLVGSSYWSADTVAGILAQICAEPMQAASARAPMLGAAFDPWFARACDRDPSKRFTTAAEQVEELALALGLPRESISSSADSLPRPSFPSSPSSPSGVQARVSRSGPTPIEAVHDSGRRPSTSPRAFSSGDASLPALFGSDERPTYNPTIDAPSLARVEGPEEAPARSPASPPPGRAKLFVALTLAAAVVAMLVSWSVVRAKHPAPGPASPSTQADFAAGMGPSAPEPKVAPATVEEPSDPSATEATKTAAHGEAGVGAAALAEVAKTPVANVVEPPAHPLAPPPARAPAPRSPPRRPETHVVTTPPAPPSPASPTTTTTDDPLRDQK